MIIYLTITTHAYPRRLARSKSKNIKQVDKTLRKLASNKAHSKYRGGKEQYDLNCLKRRVKTRVPGVRWKDTIHRSKANKQALKATRDTQYCQIPWADMKAALEARKGTESGLSTALAVSTLASLIRAKRDKVPRK